MFYVVSDGCPTEHRGKKRPAEYTHFDHFFVEVTPETVKVTRGFYF